MAKVDEKACVACNACVTACPRNIIRIIPRNSKKYTEIPCASHDKGPVVRQACDNGCIGCKICVKACPKEGAITVENFLAKINYDICIGCGLCSRACPRKLITVDGVVLPPKPKKPAAPKAEAAPLPRLRRKLPPRPKLLRRQKRPLRQKLPPRLRPLPKRLRQRKPPRLSDCRNIEFQ